MGPLTYEVLNLHFSIGCGTYNSYLHTTISPSSVSPSKFTMLTPQAEALSSAHNYLYRHCRTQWNSSLEHSLSRRLSTQGVGRTLRRISTLIPLLGHEGSQGNHPHPGHSNHTSEKDTTLLPKTLRQ